jgi:3-oxoacyl-[acyl-carrier-protein] synthase II
MTERVVVTGIGLLTPIGTGIEENWASLMAGKSGIGPITQFDSSQFATHFAGELKGFEPTQWIDKREAKTLDRFLQIAVAAGKLAMDDAGLPQKLDGEAAERAGCYVGAGLGGVITLERTYANYLEKGPRHGFSPYFVPSMIVNLAPGQLSIRHNLKGPNISHVSACSTGAHSIGEAMRALQVGTADVMVAGGVEATISVLGVGGFNAMRAMSTRNDAPEKASRPFDAERDGFVIGEGAGICVLETLTHAKARGARIYAELKGYGATADAFHITQPAPEGEGAQRSMRAALRDAKLAPDAVGYINAHGTSTKFNDANETKAIKAVFGEHARKIAVSSTKSMTGHTLGAAGGIETAYSALAMHRNALPPTINYEHPDPECDLDYVPNVAREAVVDAVLSNSFGFGGTNATLVLTRWKGE